MEFGALAVLRLYYISPWLGIMGLREGDGGAALSRICAVGYEDGCSGGLGAGRGARTMYHGIQ